MLMRLLNFMGVGFEVVMEFIYRIEMLHLWNIKTRMTRISRSDKPEKSPKNWSRVLIYVTQITIEVFEDHMPLGLLG